MALIGVEFIYDISSEVLKSAGVGERGRAIIADSIQYAHLADIPTHGIGRLPLYVKMIELGLINPEAQMEIVKQSNAVLVLDACNGFGQIATHTAIELGTSLAREYGISVVGVRNSNNFGAASYFGRMAADKGFVCLIFANAAPAIAPPGGTKPILGTNPLCIALPGSDKNPPVVLDMAMTVAARGKIRQAARLGEKIPDGWAVNSEGEMTNDPVEALKGSLLAAGGYKGFALSFMVDALAGMLTGSAFAGDVLPLSDEGGPSRNGHLLILIHADTLMDSEHYRSSYDRLIENVRSKGASGHVYLPGDAYEHNKDKEQREVELPSKLVKEINQLAQKQKILLRLPLAETER